MLNKKIDLLILKYYHKYYRILYYHYIITLYYNI